MASQQNLDGQFDFSLDGSVLSSSGHKGSESADLDDPASYEKFILEGMDSYWDDLNTCLIVSRMVNDAVIKGMVNAVAQEAADKISSKDTQMADLSEKLRCYELDAARGNKLGTPSMQENLKESKSEQPSFIDFCMEQNHLKHLSCLKIEAEEHLQKLKSGIEYVRSSASVTTMSLGSGNKKLCIQEKAPENLAKMEGSLDGLMETVGCIYQEIGGALCLFSNSFSEQQWRWDFQKEVANVIVNNHIKGLLEEFNTKLFRERNIYISQNNCSITFDKLTSLRNELDVINKSLFNSEAGYLMTQGSHENNDEWNGNDKNSRKVLGNNLSPYSSHTQGNDADTIEKSEVAESPLLAHMTRDDLALHFKTEMMKMKRNHELALHQKTEELFMAKRELLKEKGSVSSRKDREFEILRKRISDFVIKLDDILLENEKFTAVQDDYYKLCDYQDHYDNLIHENQRLRDLLSDKKREIKSLSSQLSDAASQMSNLSSVEAKFLKQIQKLLWNIEDMKIEANLRDEILNIVLREAIVEIKSLMEISGMEVKFDHEIHAIILQGFMRDIRSSINAIIEKYDEEKKFLESSVMQKDEVLGLEVEKSKKLKHDIESLLQLVKEKEKSEQEAASNYLQQKEQFEVVCKELLMLKDETSEQEILILQNRKESDLLNSRLQEANDQAQLYREEMFKLDEMLNDALNNLMEADIQNKVLHEIIKQKQNRLDTLALEKGRREELMKSVAFSVRYLSKAFDDFGSNVAENIQRNNSRLEKLNYQQDSILQEAVSIRKEVSCYKHTLETKYSNLQKAETEVDLLGDEVDALLNLLAKVYIALDHYSPVLQHYPGVMEILKLVRRELEGTAKPLPL